MSDNSAGPGGKDSPTTTIVIGVTIGVITAVFGFLGGKMVTKTPAPTAEISPTMVTARADEPVQFDASGSSALDGNEHLAYSWRVGGQPLADTPLAACRKLKTGAIIECRFAVPGTYGVGVTVTNASDLSDTASSAVTVIIPGG